MMSDYCGTRDERLLWKLASPPPPRASQAKGSAPELLLAGPRGFRAFPRPGIFLVKIIPLNFRSENFGKIGLLIHEVGGSGQFIFLKT